VQNKKIQTKITKYATIELSNYLNAKIEIDQVYITFFNRILLKNTYVEDQNGDTLLFAKKAKITLSNFRVKNKSITIRRLALNNADIHLISDSTGLINLDFIIQELINPDKPKENKWNVEFNSIELEESRFRYTNLKPGENMSSSNIDFSKLELNDLDVKAEDFYLIEGGVDMKVKDFSFTEISGFRVDKIYAELNLNKTHMWFTNLLLITPESEISANALKFNFESYKDFQDIINLIDMELNLRSSTLYLNDLGYFSSQFKGFNEKVRLSGLIQGRVSDLKGDNILLAFNDHTNMDVSFNIFGLPDIAQTYMDYDIRNFETNIYDLELLNLPGNKKLNIPEKLNNLGKITYKGKFTGYPDDFVAFGRIGTNLGIISMDIMLKPGTDKSLKYQGRVKTESFNLSKLSQNKIDIGKINTSFSVDGTSNQGNISANLQGEINSIEVNNYNYKNVNISGFLGDKTFDGSLNIDDPNIKLDFLGKVDFASEVPVFEFTADVARIRPYYLNIIETDPSYFASFLMESNFKGKNIDDMEGKINLINSFFRKDDYQIQVYDFKIESVILADSSILRINSDILDAEMKGHYHFSTLEKSFKNIALHYLPSLANGKPWKADSSDLNRFEYDIKLKNVKNVASFFFSDIQLANNTNISGFYFPQILNFEIQGNSDLIGYKGNEWKDLYFKASSDSAETRFISYSTALYLNEELSLDSLKINGNISRDTVIFDLNWNNNKNPRYQGRISMLANIADNPKSKHPSAHIRLQPSSVIFNDTLWNISASQLYIDSTSIRVDSFSLSHNDQIFMVDGGIAKDASKSLRFHFKDLDLSLLNIFTKKWSLEMYGNVSGNASLTDPFNKPLFLSDLKMENLILNDQALGEGELRALWDNTEKKISILSTSVKGQSEIFRIAGDYFPANKALDFNIKFDKLNLKSISPYTNQLISDIKGLGSGRLKLTGTAEKPELNGDVSLFKTSFIVNYLQTRYNFSNKVEVTNNMLIINDFDFYDENGNTARANGRIFTRYLKDINLDLNFTTKNFAFLNTTEKDNELFYGQIYAGGLIRIYGPPDNLTMDIDAKSSKNSVFYIPLFGNEEINETNFIKFVNSDSDQNFKQINKAYEVDLRGLTMNFILDVTPDAEVQLIFDPKIGDILRGRGNGNLKISINSLGKFEILGDIIIEEGDYLFTLQNVINKKFEVEKGGRISWNGDPADADIDLKAVYELRTSVYNLAPDQSNNLKKRIPVECIISMTGKLMNPNIKPDIVLPTADQETKNIVTNTITTDEEMMKQFLSLLVINSFYSDQLLSGESSGSRNTVAMAGVATSELLSNQLSHWLSQISNDFDIGFNYRPGDEITSTEVEVALSTQIINDRITLNGNLDVSGNQNNQTANPTNTNNIVGDFDIDFQITKNGKLHLKAFNRANDNLLLQPSPYTQGVGVFYREDFNNVNELFKRYKDAIRRLFSSKAVKTKPEEESVDL
jgi:hypothetical protein